MDLKWQSLFLIILLLASVAITQINSTQTSEAVAPNDQNTTDTATSSDFLAFQSSALTDFKSVEKMPVRKWDILDPEVSADVVLVHSLDDQAPLYYSNTHQPHVLASLTKLITSMVVLEEIGLDKQIPISQEVVDTRGFAGNLTSGEVYDSRTLLKIMLLTSSNDAAAAFEDYLGGTEEFLEIANRKMYEVGIKDTVIEDGSGLSDFNKGTASDMMKISKYILENHPRVFLWSRDSEALVQPLNDSESRTETNINPLVDNRNYLGGKTGTSQVAGQNLVALFNSNDRRVLIIIMGSEDRYEDVEILLDWINEAYKF